MTIIFSANDEHQSQCQNQNHQQALQSPKQHANLFFLSIPSAEILQSIYLRYIRNGGVFIPGVGNYALGDQVFVLLSLVEEKRKIPLCAAVVWITPLQSQENKRPGIGVRFIDPENRTRALIERYLPEIKKDADKLPENTFHFVM